MNTNTYAKLPPQSIELEEAVLGAILLESDCLYSVSEILTTPEVFYKSTHQVIFEAVQSTVRSGSKVDILTVTDELRKLGKLEEVGGAYGVMKITLNVVTSAHVIDHARKIHHYWQRREIIRLSGEAMQEAYEDDCEASKTGETICKAVSDVLDNGASDTTTHAEIVAGRCIETLEKAMNNPGVLTGVDTGLYEVNRITNGWENQSVNILAARPSQGKTALALIFALNSDKPTLIFSLEMSAEALVDRMLSSISGVPLDAIKKGTCTHAELNAVVQARELLRRKKLFIDDKAGLNTNNYQARVRRWKRKINLGLVIVDYLQLMIASDRKGKGNREVEVAEISRTLKLAAKENNVATIALSQMNREIEKVKRKPNLSDLRESGAIEQDADTVLFIWHEEDPNEGRIRNKLVVAKNRNGKTDDIELKFNPINQRWTDVNDFTNTETFNPYAGISNNHQYFEQDPF